MVRIRSGAFVLPYRVGRCRCHEICRLDANFNVFLCQFWIIFDAKSVHFWVSKAFGQMLRNKRPKLIEIEVVNAKKLLRLGALSEQKWVWAWVLKFKVFQRPSCSLQTSIWTAFSGESGVPRPFSRACFSGFQLRDTIIEKNAPLPGENHVFAC